jgi:hypothetical protein
MHYTYPGAFEDEVHYVSDRVATDGPTGELMHIVTANGLVNSEARRAELKANTADALARPFDGRPTAARLSPYCRVCGSPDHAMHETAVDGRLVDNSERPR